MRNIYISGKYRHWDVEGNLLDALMDVEIADEHRWELLVAECGHIPYPPLRLTVPLEKALAAKGIRVDAEFWIRADLIRIAQMTPEHDAILMREGWENDSVGAKAEYDAATERGLIVIPGYWDEEEEIRKYLKEELV